jgi:hypothetical protein
LVEILLALTILLLVGAAAIAPWGGQGIARRGTVDQLTGWIEQARTRAVLFHATVALVVAPPGALSPQERTASVALVRLADGWLSRPVEPVDAVLMGRWKPLDTGIVLLPGGRAGLSNPIDAPTVRIRMTNRRSQEVGVHVLAFNGRGRLAHPAGSSPAMLRVAEGRYRDGVAIAGSRGSQEVIPESVIQIGRILGRAYECNP